MFSWYFQRGKWRKCWASFQSQSSTKNWNVNCIGWKFKYGKTVFMSLVTWMTIPSEGFAHSIIQSVFLFRYFLSSLSVYISATMFFSCEICNPGLNIHWWMKTDAWDTNTKQLKCVWFTNFVLVCAVFSPSHREIRDRIYLPPFDFSTIRCIQ